MNPSAHQRRRSIQLSHRLPALLAILILPMVLASQDAPKTPQVRVSTRLVQIGVIVREGNHAVGDLTINDFTVLDRGKPQKISVFSAESSGTTLAPSAPLPQNTFSDLPQYGTSKPRSVTIVLLDNLNTLTGSSARPNEDTPYWLEDLALASGKQRLLEFIKQMDLNDRIAIYGLTDSLHVLCDLTCDREQLLSVVSNYNTYSRTQREMVVSAGSSVQQLDPEGPDGFNSATNTTQKNMASLNTLARSQATMAALVAIAAHVTDIPGRKNLLWLTGNLPFSGEEVGRILSRANIAAYPVDARGLLVRGPLNTGDAVLPTEAKARSVLGLTAPENRSDQPIGLEAMVKMAEETGGRAYINTNDLTGAIREAVEDSAVTYTLGFYVDAAAVDGKFHEIKVEVARKGLNLRYPKGYFALKDAPATQDERHNSFLAAVRSPLNSSAIPLQVKVDRVNEPTPNSLSLFGSIDIQNLQLAQNGAVREGALDVTVVQQDKTGKVLNESTNRLTLKFTEEKYAAILKSGINFRKPIQPVADVVVLRVLVQDPNTAAIGSLIIPLSKVK